jgi:hypothetical protein
MRAADGQGRPGTTFLCAKYCKFTFKLLLISGTGFGETPSLHSLHRQFRQRVENLLLGTPSWRGVILWGPKVP